MSKDNNAVADGAGAGGADQEMYADEIDAVSTVALLIDDLSSEDPNAKLHSI
jgi:serine/threonine-protein phosphatase 2A regulatory subunit A